MPRGTVPLFRVEEVRLLIQKEILIKHILRNSGFFNEVSRNPIDFNRMFFTVPVYSL
jgi:hypothetical protein